MAGGEVSTRAGAFDEALLFDGVPTETISVTVDGKPLKVHKYAVTYVANPVKIASSHRGPATDPTAWQKMIIYVPETAANDQETAIIFAVGNSGWLSSSVSDAIEAGKNYVSNSDTDRVGAILAAGYVFCNVGTRSRGLVAVNGTYPGKAPAVVVDAKAAIRYLKLNDAAIPGSSEKIVITGTSGGGGLSVAVAASGNSPDYYPYLLDIGAAGIDAFGNSTISDAVFATIAYCPITDLDHVDYAYEWQYSAMRLRGDYNDGQNPPTAATMALSVELAAQYPAYLASLGLKLEDGTALNAATMPGAIVALVKADVEKKLKAGVNVPDLGEDWSFQTGNTMLVVKNDWLDIDKGAKTVVSINYDKYLEFVCKTAKLKTAPSFDNYGTPHLYQRNESNLSGNLAQEYSHWIKWSWENDNIKGNGVGLDDTGLSFEAYMASPAGKAVVQQMKMINPMPYLISDEGVSAPYWYVRHGMRDRDTSFNVPVALYYALYNDPTIKDVNFAIAYMQGHGGNYDVREAYAWLAGILD
jgi:hypothetical protein